MIKLFKNKCFEVFKNLPDNSIDLILSDPPYGKTKCSWDRKIPLEPLWIELKRLLKPNGVIVLTADQPFTSELIMSNPGMFKYTWVWEKPNAKGFLNAKKRPLKAHEDIVVFYKKQPTYNPQMTYGHKKKTALKKQSEHSEVYNKNTKDSYYNSTSRYPRSVQKIKQDTQKSSLYPNQKPLALMEYFIRTYTNPKDMVLDFAMGSGTTGVGCRNLDRSFIGIDSSLKAFDIARMRIGI